MKKLIFVLVFIIFFLTACIEESMKSGVIYNKEYIQSHVVQERKSERKYNWWRETWEIHHYYEDVIIPDKWYIDLEDEINEKRRTIRLEISEELYNELKIGNEYKLYNDDI